MTAEAKAPTRRLLGRYQTWAEAKFKAIYWANGPENDDVQVELGVKGTTAEQPWAVTATRPRGRSA